MIETEISVRDSFEELMSLQNDLKKFVVTAYEDKEVVDYSSATFSWLRNKEGRAITIQTLSYLYIYESLLGNAIAVSKYFLEDKNE